MGPIGVPEMVAIFILALVLFGPRKLPELGRTIGKAMTEFRRASNDLKATFEREMQSLERENQSIQQATRKAAREITDQTYDINPSESLWNALEGLDESKSDESKQDDTKQITSGEESSEQAHASMPETFDYTEETGTSMAGLETASPQDHPALVGASAASGAESTSEPNATEVAEASPEPAGPNGRVPRGTVPDEPTHS